MNDFDAARDLYRDAKRLLDATRDPAAANDELRWAREDIEEDLLDLKLAVIDGNSDELPELTFNVQRMIAVIIELLGRPPRSDESEDA